MVSKSLYLGNAAVCSPRFFLWVLISWANGYITPAILDTSFWLKGAPLAIKILHTELAVIEPFFLHDTLSAAGADRSKRYFAKRYPFGQSGDCYRGSQNYGQRYRKNVREFSTRNSARFIQGLGKRQLADYIVNSKLLTKEAEKRHLDESEEVKIRLNLSARQYPHVCCPARAAKGNDRNRRGSPKVPGRQHHQV